MINWRKKNKMKWKIPLSDIDFGEEEIVAVTKILRSKWLTMGEVTQEFEKRFADYLGIKYAFAVSSGTAALHIAHRALGIGKGDEVICPSLTFVATANSILYTGATPVFADITSLDDFNMLPDNIQEKVSSKTKAVTVVHYGGYPCDMNRITEIAKEHNLYLIEDAAHAIGTEYNGKKCGTIGDIGCFSFFSNKNLVTGEGGMVVTNNDEFAKKIKLLRSHGMTTLTLDRYKGHAHGYDVIELGYNYRTAEINSAIGLVQLSKLDKNNEKRKKITKRYRELLGDTLGVQIPFKSNMEESSCHLFPVLLNKKISREKFISGLKETGIQTSIHYPPIHLFSYYRKRFEFQEDSLPLTEEVGKREVTLPLYPMLSREDIFYVVKALKGVLNNIEK